MLLYRDLTAAILITSLLSMSGCIIPVAPDFQAPDPLGSPNYAPELSLDMPHFGTVRTLPAAQGGMFAFAADDPNPTDHLWVHWVLDYPEYVQGISKLVQSNPDVAPNTDKSLRQFSLLVSCLQGPSMSTSSNLHTLTVLVADRLWADMGAALDTTEGTDGKISRGSWAFYLTCPTGPTP